jgi:hypothetical protein
MRDIGARAIQNSARILRFERRRKQRINEPIPVTVRGSEGPGKTYCFNTVVRNIGSGGLCASAPRIMKTGETVAFHIRFARAGSDPIQAPEVAVHAVVVRVEEENNGSCVFAASFLIHLFI